MKITKNMLKGACTDQLKTFIAEWPDGAKVTLKNCRRAAELKLDINWLASRVLTAPALAKYEKARASAWAEYEKARAPAWAEYDKATASAWAEYEKARASAFYHVALRERIKEGVTE